MPTGQNLIDSVRLTMSDEIGVDADRLVTDAELLEFLNDAEREACIRRRLLVDSSTAAQSLITLVGGTAEYALNSKVISVDRAKVQATSDPSLYQTTRRNLDLTDPDWETESGTPRNFLLEDISATKTMRLYPNPSAAGVLQLTVVRLPLTDILIGTVPEIPEPLHNDLTYWMLFRVFNKQDSKIDQENNTVGLKKNKFFLEQFVRVFGERPVVEPGFVKTSPFRD